MEIPGVLLSHPTGTRAVLIGSVVLVLSVGIGAWLFVRPSATAPRRRFARSTLACFAATAAWLILVPILFRIFDLPGSRGPVQSTCGDPVALQVFHARGVTVLIALGSLALSPLLALAVGRTWRLLGSRALLVAGAWAVGVSMRILDLRFWPTV